MSIDRTALAARIASLTASTGGNGRKLDPAKVSYTLRSADVESAIAELAMPPQQLAIYLGMVALCEVGKPMTRKELLPELKAAVGELDMFKNSVQEFDHVFDYYVGNGCNLERKFMGLSARRLVAIAKGK